MTDTNKVDVEPVAYEQVALKFATGKKITYEKPVNIESYIELRPLVYASALAAEQAKVRELVEVLRKCQPYVEQALDVVGGMDEYYAESELHTAIAKHGKRK